MVIPEVVGAVGGTTRGGVGLLVVLLGVVEVAGGTTRGVGGGCWWYY